MPKDSSLSARERFTASLFALAFLLVFTGLFALIILFGEPFADLRKYPLNPNGWVVMHNGVVLRDAKLWDMLKAKYLVVVFLLAYIAVIAFTAAVFLSAVRGRRNRLNAWLLSELAKGVQWPGNRLPPSNPALHERECD